MINNEEEEGKGKERKAPTRKIKISKFSHGSRVTKFRTMAQRAWRWHGSTRLVRVQY